MASELVRTVHYSLGLSYASETDWRIAEEWAEALTEAMSGDLE